MKSYLDNGATTIVDPAVVKAMIPFFSDIYGNPSSVHNVGQEAKRYLDESREVIAKKIRSSFDEIIFTSGGTESDNLAIIGFAGANKDKGKHIITTNIEHPAVTNSCDALKKEGFDISKVGVDKVGFVDIEKLEGLIRDDTILVSVIHGNNEIGTIQDISVIGDVCRKHGVTFHTDAVQSFTKVPIDVKNIPVDMISFSSHKIHGPKGIGALYIRKGIKISPTSHGGGHEFNKRAGTENIPGIIGFARAIKLASHSHCKNMSDLRDYFISKVFEEISDVKLNGPKGDSRLCNNVNISFANIEAESLGAYLDVNGICTSSGSACSSHSLQPSHVLIAIGIDKELANGTLRFTLSRFTTKEEIDYTVDVLKKHANKLRKISPLKRVLKNVF
ncbi:cysteine desulfurase [Candidatus Woesearchaeota archaeon]|nr:cysteine desulfurase [Candidatus Woesearchaeota archaeon]